MTAIQARRRLLVAWNLSNGFRVAIGWAALVTSAALSVRESPWIGFPAGLAIFGVGVLLGRLLDRAYSRRLLGPLLPAGTADIASLHEATEAVSSKYWGTAQGVRPFVFMRRFLDVTLIVLCAFTYMEAAWRLGGVAAQPAPVPPARTSGRGYEVVALFAAIFVCALAKEWIWSSLVRRLMSRAPATWSEEGRPLWMLPLPQPSEVPGGFGMGVWQSTQRARWRWLFRTPVWARDDRRSRAELWAVRALSVAAMSLVAAWFALAFRG